MPAPSMKHKCNIIASSSCNFFWAKRKLVTILVLCSAFFATAQAQKKQKNTSQIAKKPALEIFKVSRPDSVAAFEIYGEGDTINRTDELNLKQGLWMLNTPARYGEPAQLEIGMYRDGWKQGLWKVYQGPELIRKEHYWNNLLHGAFEHYEQSKLVCEGFYNSQNYKTKFDTVRIVHEYTNQEHIYIIPNNPYTEKDSNWTYYRETGEISLKQKYNNGELVWEKKFEYTYKDLEAIDRYEKLLPHNRKKQLPVPFQPTGRTLRNLNQAHQERIK